MIKVENMSFKWTDKPIFDNISFSVNDGEKIGLVGINGSGKTTLFKILSGLEQADDGHIRIDNKMTFVPQEIKYDEIMDRSKNIFDYLNPFNKPIYEVTRILVGLGLKKINLDDSPQILSGGQKTRLALARAILDQSKILLLDEPTNFLDEEGKKWVISFISRFKGTLILVSHDLDLLDGTLNKIFYINSQTKKIDIYGGNYSNFVELKGNKEDLLKRKVETEQKHLRQMKQGLLKISHFKSKKGVKVKLNLQRRIEKAEENMPVLPPEAKKIKLILPEPIWVGEIPIFTKNISKSFGQKKVLNQVNLTIKRGEKTALLGPNGAGKSTLIKILLGNILPDSGEVVRDSKLKWGYYCQELSDLDMEINLFETIKKLESGLNEGQIRSLLGKMLFVGDKIFQKVSVLSGGEKTRLSIARLLAQNFNFLVLDEPTTYLDYLSQRLILDAIKSYKGALLIVSHNQEFIDELNVDQTFFLPDNIIKNKLTI
ncbi:MAG: ABC-F family ATP-binding cassette domain-containing protein [Candidatus Shapirobacteria bacterium]|nr:ABC-F family ATP-binding cassette domain-containing protein [Candidatus Shapirobacteria bacterium]